MFFQKYKFLEAYINWNYMFALLGLQFILVLVVKFFVINTQLRIKTIIAKTKAEYLWEIFNPFEGLKDYLNANKKRYKDDLYGFKMLIQLKKQTKIVSFNDGYQKPLIMINDRSLIKKFQELNTKNQFSYFENKYTSLFGFLNASTQSNQETLFEIYQFLLNNPIKKQQHLSSQEVEKMIAKMDAKLSYQAKIDVLDCYQSLISEVFLRQFIDFPKESKQQEEEVVQQLKEIVKIIIESENSKKFLSFNRTKKLQKTIQKLSQNVFEQLNLGKNNSNSNKTPFQNYIHKYSTKTENKREIFQIFLTIYVINVIELSQQLSILTYIVSSGKEEDKKQWLQQLPHCFTETKRMFPCYPISDKNIIKKAQHVDNFYFYKGVRVQQNFVMQNYNEENYETPFEFVPNRWENDSKENDSNNLTYFQNILFFSPVLFSQVLLHFSQKVTPVQQAQEIHQIMRYDEPKNIYLPKKEFMQFEITQNKQPKLKQN